MRKSYVNRYTVTKEKYLNWVRHPIRKGKGNKKQIWPVMSLVTVGIAVYFYVAGQTVYALFFLALTFLSVSGALLLSQILAAKEFKKLAAYHGASQWERVIRFSEDKIYLTDGKLKAEYPYASITDFVNKKEYFALRFNRGSYLRVYKNGFVRCTPADFIKFMKTKLPKLSYSSEK